jgi:hypothetical protein
MIRVSHEMPLDALCGNNADINNHYNEYGYCLVHLLEQNKKYYDYYKKICKDREVYLDNSIFELGKAFDSDKFAHYIEDINPSAFIVPDVLEDSSGTIDSFIKFREKFPHLFGPDTHRAVIGVVQGRTLDEMVACYKFMYRNADIVAISFDYEMFTNSSLDNKWNQLFTSEHYLLTDLEKMAISRPILLDYLNKVCSVPFGKPHHLLGMSLLKELDVLKAHEQELKNFYIRSIDTSNPIVSGMLGIRYNGVDGLFNYKPKALLANLIDEGPLTHVQSQAIRYNCSIFRNKIRSIQNFR